MPLKPSVPPLEMLTLEVSSVSILYLIRIWTTCWPNVNQIVWSKMYNICALWQNNRVFFLIKALTLFCKTFLSLKQLFNGNLIIFRLLSFSVPRIRLKFTPNMADPTGMKQPVGSLKILLCFNYMSPWSPHCIRSLRQYWHESYS